MSEEGYLPAPKTERPIKMPDGFLLSVMMPVYNEKETIHQIIKRVREVDIPKEIVIVDDYSTDGTRDILEEYDKDDDIRVFLHEKNKGKGAALRTALDNVKGTHIVVQDADLEYDPDDYPVLLRPILESGADVVYGSRFIGERRVFLFSHYVGNRLLTLITNVLYSCTLTDMETCYKCFRAEVFEKVKLRSNRFEIEPEITAKILKNGFRVFEVPIRYSGRNFEEGKKITWRDGITALWSLIKFRVMD